MADESISLPVTPESSDDRRAHSDSLRHSTGKLRSSVVSARYLRASTASCHDFCKYGRHHEFKAKGRHSIPKRIIRKHDDDEAPPVQGQCINEQKARVMPSAPSGKLSVTKSNESTSRKVGLSMVIPSFSKHNPLQLNSASSNTLDELDVERRSNIGTTRDVKTPKTEVMESLPTEAPSSFPKAAVIEMMPLIAPISFPNLVPEGMSIKDETLKHKNTSTSKKTESKDSNKVTNNERSSPSKSTKNHKRTVTAPSSEQKTRSEVIKNQNKNDRKGIPRTAMAMSNGTKKSEPIRSRKDPDKMRTSHTVRSSKDVSLAKSRVKKAGDCNPYFEEDEKKCLHDNENEDGKMILECADHGKVISDIGNRNGSECNAKGASETNESSSENNHIQRLNISVASHHSTESPLRMTDVSEVTRLIPEKERELAKKSLLEYAEKEMLISAGLDVTNLNKSEYTFRGTIEISEPSSLHTSEASHNVARSRPRMAQISEIPPAKLAIKRGKVIKLPSENKSPRQLKLRRGGIPAKSNLEFSGHKSLIAMRSDHENPSKKSDSTSGKNQAQTVNTSRASTSHLRSSKNRPRMAQLSEISSPKLTFRRGKVIELPLENKSPRRLKFKRDRELTKKSTLEYADQENRTTLGSDFGKPNESEHPDSEISERSEPSLDDVQDRTVSISGASHHSSKSRPRVAQIPDVAPTKLTFRRGKVIELPSEIKTPRRLKFKQGRVLKEGQDVRIEVRRGNFRKRDPGDAGTTSRPGSVKVVLKHQDVEGRTNAQGLLNNVIEETASKLVEMRKSKVKALVGAFETVISLQEKQPLF